MYVVWNRAFLVLNSVIAYGVRWSTQAITYQFLLLYRFTNLCLSLSHGLAVQTHGYKSIFPHWACERLQLQAHVRGTHESNHSASAATIYSFWFKRETVLGHVLACQQKVQSGVKKSCVISKCVCVCLSVCLPACLPACLAAWLPGWLAGCLSVLLLNNTSDAKSIGLRLGARDPFFIVRFCVSFR